MAQPATVARDVAANARLHAVAIDRLPSPPVGDRDAGGVVVFPELSLTGYHLDAPVVDVADDRLAPIVEACRRTGLVALAGAPTGGWTGNETADDDDGAAAEHISVLVVDGDGVRVAYRKWFLGGAEARRFAPGPGPAVVEVGGWRLGLAVCRDTGIAEHAEASAALGIDAYLAGVCDHEQDHLVMAERARRIAATHGVWVAVASFAGPTGEGYELTAGRSGVWDPTGAEVGRAGPEPGDSLSATLWTDRGIGRAAAAGELD